MNCPDCSAQLVQLEAFGRASRYECPTHGTFRITDSSAAMGFWDAPNDAQVRALKNARGAAPDGREPTVFYYA